MFEILISRMTYDGQNETYISEDHATMDDGLEAMRCYLLTAQSEDAEKISYSNLIPCGSGHEAPTALIVHLRGYQYVIGLWRKAS